MQSPKRAAKKHIEMYSRQNTSAKHSRPAKTRDMSCSSKPLTHLRSARNPARIRPTVFVVPDVHTANTSSTACSKEAHRDVFTTEHVGKAQQTGKDEGHVV